MLKYVREDKFEPERYKFAFKHQEEAYRFISTYLDDNRFIKVIHELKLQNNRGEKERTGENTMCEALDKLINEGEKRGEERGEKRGMECGIERGTLQTLMSLVDDGSITVEKALTKVDMTEEEFLAKMEEAGYKISE